MSKRSYHTGTACFLMLAIVLLLSFARAFAADPATIFNKANELYKARDYSNAALQYEQLTKENFKEAEVYYNLGNCYYKLDNNAKAVLNYERALKYKPDDEDIQFNLKIAQLKLIDKIDAVPEIFYVRWKHDLYSLFPSGTWAIIITVCVWLMFLFASLYFISQNVLIRKTGFLLAFVFLILSLGSWYLGEQNYQSEFVKKSGIVMAVSAYVKSSPGEQNTDLFLLHEGTKVSVLDEYEDWVKISIANGSVGWLKKGDVEEI